MKMSQLTRYTVKNAGKYWAAVDTLDGRQVGFGQTFADAAAIAKQLERESIADRDAND
jgi:hypothetical protein